MYQSQFKNYESNPTERHFTAYGQKDPLKCKGYINTAIRKHSKVVNVNVYVTEGNAESLLGRDSSFQLKVRSQVDSVRLESGSSELNSLLKEYYDLFEGLGKIKNFEHRIIINPKVKPKGQHLRGILVSQIDAVNNNLDRMLGQDIIEEVTTPSSWVLT